MNCAFSCLFLQSVQFSINVTHPSSRPNTVARRVYVLHGTGTTQIPCICICFDWQSTWLYLSRQAMKALKNSKETKHVCLAGCFTII